MAADPIIVRLEMELEGQPHHSDKKTIINGMRDSWGY